MNPLVMKLFQKNENLLRHIKNNQLVEQTILRGNRKSQNETHNLTKSQQCSASTETELLLS